MNEKVTNGSDLDNIRWKSLRMVGSVIMVFCLSPATDSCKPYYGARLERRCPSEITIGNEEDSVLQCTSHLPHPSTHMFCFTKKALAQKVVL